MPAKRKAKARIHPKGWNEVAYYRHSKDKYIPLTKGKIGGEGPVKIPTVTVTTKSGAKYELPVDRRGKVPREYVVARFMSETQGVRPPAKARSIAVDLSRDAEVMHREPRGGWTPQQLVKSGWWQYPAESDIYGIDDTTMASEIEALYKDATKTQQAVGKRMTLIMPKASAERAIKILRENFTAAELRKAVRGEGMVIQEGHTGRGVGGYYRAKWDSYENAKTPFIMLGPNWDEDTLVHEFTHHLRHADETRGGLTRTPFPLNDKGERMMRDGLSQHEFNSARNLEEAATVAETTARTRLPTESPTGYYEHTRKHGSNYRERYAYDRGLLVGQGKPKKGRPAEKTVKAKFGDTSISGLRYYKADSAEAYLRAREAAGTMPQAVKRPKAKPKAAQGLPPGVTVAPVPVSARANPRKRKAAPKKTAGARKPKSRR